MYNIRYKENRNMGRVNGKVQLIILLVLILILQMKERIQHVTEITKMVR